MILDKLLDLMFNNTYTSIRRSVLFTGSISLSNAPVENFFNGSSDIDCFLVVNNLSEVTGTIFDESDPRRSLNNNDYDIINVSIKYKIERNSLNIKI